jgi:hypothetical protein
MGCKPGRIPKVGWFRVPIRILELLIEVMMNTVLVELRWKDGG